jgi:carbamoyltransferase
MKVLGINSVFHDPSAALVIDGQVVAAAEEERFSRRKHGRNAPTPFAAWELPEMSMAWCLAKAGLRPEDLDAVAYSYDPRLVIDAAEQGLDDPWDWLRTRYAQRAPEFLCSALPGLDAERVTYVPHHLAHAASAAFAAPIADSAVLVLDGRGEAVSHLAGVARQGKIDVLASQALPHSMGLFYEEVTAHLGFRRSSDEYKVMALASYGQPRFASVMGAFTRSPSTGSRSLPVESTARSGHRITPTSPPVPRRSSRKCCWM